MRNLMILIMLSCVLFWACSKDNGSETGAVDCSGTTKTFSGDVLPVIQSTCATNSSCHGTGSNNGPGVLSTYNQVYNNRSTIRSAVANETMPQNGSLTTAQKNAILCWIDNGAANN